MCRKVARETKAITVLRFAPTTSHQSNGFVEAVHGHIQGLARCYQTQFGTNTGLQLPATSRAIPFAVRYAGFVLTRFSVRPDGRTPFQYLSGAPYASALSVFGESVFFYSDPRPRSQCGQTHEQMDQWLLVETRRFIR